MVFTEKVNLLSNINLYIMKMVSQFAGYPVEELFQAIFYYIIKVDSENRCPLNQIPKKVR